MNIDLADIEYLKTKKIMIGVICINNAITPESFQSFIKWTEIAKQLNLTFTTETINCNTSLAMARNQLIARFMSNNDSTHLLFVDSNIVWEPHHALALMSVNKHIIGGMYPLPKLPVDLVVTQDPGMATEAHLMEVSKINSGFMLISKEAFTVLTTHNDIKPYATTNSTIQPYTYFNEYVADNGQYVSEELSFCNKWRSINGKLWINTQVQLGITGPHNFAVN